MNDRLEMLVRLWNEQADEYNQWHDLGLDEMLEFSAAVERQALSLAKKIPEGV